MTFRQADDIPTMMNAGDMENRIIELEKAVFTLTERIVALEGKKTARFVKPSREQVRIYAALLGHEAFDVDKFYDHYESNGWHVGKNKMKDWEAAVRKWLPVRPKPAMKQQARTHEQRLRESGFADLF